MSKIQKSQGQPNFPKLEEEILQFWKDKNIFEKTLENRSSEKSKTFYDGPITANGMPHHGHMLTFAMKDIFPRYWTMKGYRVDRSLGWDCQGIPVEYEIEKKLGFKEKKDIEKYGIAEFNKLCRESVMEFKGQIIDLEEKMGRLTNNDEEYATMDRDYIESIWWSLKELYTKGLLYEGFKVVPYSTRAGTTLSNAEVALGGYKPFVDPAVTVKFELVEEPRTFVLAWTTTPWTLPTNFGLAIGEAIDYVKIEKDGENYILAKECVENYFGEEVVTNLVDREWLLGKAYKPLFSFFPNKPNAYKIVYGFHVTTDSGTGVVHLAPYGAEDNEIFKEIGIEPVDVLNDQGDFTSLVPTYQGMNYRDANPKIVEYLKENNLLFKYEDYTHDMPMCWRTNTPLIYKPITSWYIAMSTLRQRLVNNNERINWTPSHIKQGRFGNWLAEIKDWGISRTRYWGTPLPVWKSESGKAMVLGSFEELEKLSGVKVDDPHRPFIDDIEFDHEGEHYKRILDVLDVWYDSGAMPFARFHYPFENREKFEKKFPAQYIAESVDQTRGWFYSLTAISTALFDSEAFQNVVMSGFVLDDNGVKLSKSKKNYTSPNAMIEKFGADTIRLNFFSTPICAGEDTTISEKTLRIQTQEFMIPLWNIYTYLTIYADLHNWTPEASLAKNERYDNNDQTWNHIPFTTLDNVLDTWLVTDLQRTIKEVTEALDAYQIPKATGLIKELIDNTSKWFIRRSRDRFAGGDTKVLEVLYYVYVETLKLLSPLAPFVTEHLYAKLVKEVVPGSLESIHLADYPEYDKTYYEQNFTLLAEMDAVRSIASIGQNLRVEKGLKLRQPLSKAFVKIKNEELRIKNELLEVIQDELNVKNVEVVEEIGNSESIVSKEEGNLIVGLDTQLTDELKEEGLLSELKRQLQNFRKTSGLQMGQKVTLKYFTQSNELRNLITKYSNELQEAISINEFIFEESLEGQGVKVEEQEVVLQIG